MLILARKENQTIKIGADICITVTEISGKTVRLGIESPRDLLVLRGELPPLSERVDPKQGDLQE